MGEINKTIIGIDFSINSTSICVRNDNKYQYFSFVANYKKDRAPFKIHDAINDLVMICPYEKLPTSKDSIQDSKNKIQNAHTLSKLILRILTIESTIIGTPDIRLEGFSFASKGNSFIDLIMFNSFLRCKLMEKWGNCISVIPPKTNKKAYSGNGNANKWIMLNSFLENTDSPLQKRLIELGLKRDAEFEIGKPVDDLVDAISLAEFSFEKEDILKVENVGKKKVKSKLL